VWYNTRLPTAPPPPSQQSRRNNKKNEKSQTTHQTYWPPIWPKKEVDAAHNTITKLTKRHKWKSTTTTTKETLKEDGHKTSQQVASRHENDDGGRPRYGHPIAQSILELTKFSLWKNCYYIHSVGGFLFFFWETDTFTCCCSFSVTHTHTHVAVETSNWTPRVAGPLSSSFAKGTDTYIIPWLYYSRFIAEKEERGKHEEMCNTRSCKSRPRLCQGSRHFQRFGRRREGERGRDPWATQQQWKI
jgi:hypothetical protein